jgi:hypothetical protein
MSGEWGTTEHKGMNDIIKKSRKKEYLRARTSF